MFEYCNYYYSTAVLMHKSCFFAKIFLDIVYTFIKEDLMMETAKVFSNGEESSGARAKMFSEDFLGTQVEDFAISAVTLAELEYGVFKSARSDIDNKQRTRI